MSTLPAPRRITRKPARRARKAQSAWVRLGGAAVATVALGLLGWWQPWATAPAGDSALIAATPVAHDAQPFSEVRPFFEKYCFDCHSGDGAEGGFALDRFTDTAGVVKDRRRWERVFQLVKVGNMPPPDADQPPAGERERIVEWLDHTLYYVDCSQPQDPGRVTIRRLNRTEYNLTVRDLIGVDFQPAADFPSDDVGYGFDNIGDVLTVPPLLIEKYLAAAEEITSRAILTADPQFFTEVFLASDMRSEGSVHDADDGGKVFPSNGTINKRVTFPRKGEYLIRIDAAAEQHGKDPARMELSIDGERKHSFDIHGDRERDFYEVRVPVDGERRRVGISFVNDYYEEGKGDRNLYVYSVTISGPMDRPKELPESHRQLVAARPGDGVSVADAARKNLTPLLRRAFRRPVKLDEVTPYVGFVEQTVDRGESFERGMQVAVQAVLVSPQFLFRVETPGAAEWSGKTTPISDIELASRLSYFLWSSMPDDELLAVAEKGKLSDDAELRAQVERMLRDPKAQALVKNFAGQWLGLRKLATNEVAPDPKIFPEFDEELRKDIWRETELFFGSVVREDRPVTELVTGRYSFLNERLAKLYRVDGVKGDEFRKVEFEDGRRSGVLTQASILTLTSYPDRTSPVKRGEWVMSNLLGDAPPEPPPVVPALDETQHAHPDLSLREQLVLHRADPGCASCHKVMDEIGFGLEHFDAIGRWRDKDGKHPIDAKGVLPGGETFDGPAELVAILSQRKDDVARCVAEKLLTYALGRGLEYYDRCAVDGIVQEMRSHEYRFSSLVHGIVTSDPFRLRRSGE